MKLIIDIQKEMIISIAEGCFGAKYNMYDIVSCVMNGTPLKEWLSSFNTDSAPQCFNKIQELKRECEKE